MNESKHVLYCMLCFRFNEAQLKNKTNMSRNYTITIDRGMYFEARKKAIDEMKSLAPLLNKWVEEGFKKAEQGGDKAPPTQDRLISLSDEQALEIKILAARSKRSVKSLLEEWVVSGMREWLGLNDMLV